MISILERYKWKKVVAPKAWKPKLPGDELAGFYGGKTVRTGTYGQYEVVLVHVPGDGVRMISGVRIAQLVDAAMIEVGWPVRIQWEGLLKYDGEKTMKQFSLLVAEGDPLSAEDLPQIKGTEAAIEAERALFERLGAEQSAVDARGKE